MKKLILLACALLLSSNALAQNATIAGSAAAGSLTGTTLASNVVASSLTSAAGGSFGTAAFLNTGTSGATVARLDGVNSWSQGASFAGNNQVGAGGTANSAPAYITINGSSGTAGGAATLLQKNTVFQWGAGHVSSISGSGTSSDWELFNYGTSTAPITVAFSDNTTTLIGPITASNAAIKFSALAADTATTDSTACVKASDGTILKGSGTLGICLGTSGAQFKTALVPMAAGINEIAKLDLLNYRYKEGFGDSGERVQYGLTAQQVATVMPDLVRYDERGDAINFDIGALLPVALHAIQQLKADNDDLHACHENWRCRIFGIKKATP